MSEKVYPPAKSHMGTGTLSDIKLDGNQHAKNCQVSRPGVSNLFVRSAKRTICKEATGWIN